MKCLILDRYNAPLIDLNVNTYLVYNLHIFKLPGPAKSRLSIKMLKFPSKCDVNTIRCVKITRPFQQPKFELKMNLESGLDIIVFNDFCLHVL